MATIEELEAQLQEAEAEETNANLAMAAICKDSTLLLKQHIARAKKASPELAVDFWRGENTTEVKVNFQIEVGGAIKRLDDEFLHASACPSGVSVRISHRKLVFSGYRVEWNGALQSWVRDTLGFNTYVAFSCALGRILFEKMEAEVRAATSEIDLLSRWQKMEGAENLGRAIQEAGYNV